jgi:type IV pilus assembly protein PilB
VVLIVGPTGSGKSSTMYTMIRELNTEKVNLVTLEDPVEYNIPGINQVQINEKTGMTFASGLRSILRQDPDIIAVGEIRDGETAQIAMRAAITGHLVLSTIHTNDAVSTVDRLMDIGVEPYLISNALNGVISQRLVRRVCPECRAEYTPSREELEDMGIPADSGQKFYHGEGCPACFGTGYRGRVAVFEILTVSKALRRAIGKSAKREELEDIALREGGLVTLRENCRRLVMEGITTVEEARRIIAAAEE